MNNDDNSNPRLVIGAPQPASSLEELKAWVAENGFLGALLIETGYFYGKEAPGDVDSERSGGRDR
jgi:hypothetical protein